MTENTAFASEEFSPGELAYMQSGGQNVTALEGELQALMDQAKTGAGPSTDQDPGQVPQVPQVPPDPGHAGPSADQVAGAAKPAGQGLAPDAPNADQAKGQGERPGFVPVNALHEERARRQEIERQLAQERERFSRVDERQKVLNELLGLEPGQPPSPGRQPEPTIDPEKDIFGAFKQLQARYEALQGNQKQVNDQVSQQNAETQLRQAYTSDAREFLTKTPDFPQAYNHLMQARDQELTALGVQDPKERRAIMVREEGMIARNALTAGRSPSEMIYSLAKLRGFQGPASSAPATLHGVTPGSQPGQATPANESDAAKQLAAVQAARAGALSLSNAGSSAAPALTSQALADMPEEEFEKTYNSLSESQRRRLMGG